GRAVEIHLLADMLAERNTTVLHFIRPARASSYGTDLPDDRQVSVTVRVDLVDRNFHGETHRNAGSEYHFQSHSHPLAGRTGMEFTPAPDRQVRIFSDGGFYHHEGEWSMGIEHPIEASRGQPAQEDAFSPGWFELPLANGTSKMLV